MKFLSLCLLVLTATPSTIAWPGMKTSGNPSAASHAEKYRSLHNRLNERANGVDDGSGTPELIGDLRTQGATTPTGQKISDILLSKGGSPESEPPNPPYSPPGQLKTPKCQKDTCCRWFWVSQFLTAQFTNPDGTCNDDARASVRLGFHDAGTWSKSLAAQGKDFGGADGSLILSAEEINRPANGGLADIRGKAAAWSNKFGVGVADMVQFMSIHATVTCPLGPRLYAFVGRKDSSRPSVDGLLPDVHAPADELIALFEDKTIPPHDLAALLGAHSTSKQFGVDPARAGQAQDETVGVWDVRFYNTTLVTAKTGIEPPGVFVFPSDKVISLDPRTNNEWEMFIDHQDHWNEDYAKAYTRLSLLGVNNINQLKDCSDVLPPKKSLPNNGGKGKGKGKGGN